MPFARASVVLHLFGGAEFDEYLGCLTCSFGAHESVCNQSGPYGGESTPASIWNAEGPYGSMSASASPWNEHSYTAPGIFDTDGYFYGLFTVNAEHPKRTRIPAIINVLEKFASERDLARTRTFACSL